MSRILFRHFAYRFVDNDLIAADGETHQTAANIIAICAGFGFTLAVFQALKYSFGGGTAAFERLRPTTVLLDQELLISLSMLAAAIATALSWDALFPERRDCLVLGPLPLKTTQLLTAKLSAVLVVIFLLVGVTLACPALIMPFLAEPTFLAILRSLLIEIVILFAAAAFVFFAFLAFQALLLHLLPYRIYLAVSPVIQVALLLGSLAMFMLVPNFTALQKQGGGIAWWLPPAWFLVLQQNWLGVQPPLPSPLGTLALQALSAVSVSAILLYAGGFRRTMKKAVESSELSLSPPRLIRRAYEALLNATLLRDPKRRTVFWFTARSIARNPKHRLLLSIYFAAGFVWVVQGLQHGLRVTGGRGPTLPNAAQLTMPLDFALFLLIGLRVLFALPVALPANWIFRITESGAASRYLSGARTFLRFAALVPVAVIPFPIYASIWGWKIALIHTTFLTLIALLLVERLLWRFPKIPFTCSYLPGKANLKARLGAYFILFIGLSSFLSAIEINLLRSETAWMKVLPFFAIVLAVVIWRRRRIEGDLERFQFEETTAWWFARLNLER